MPSGTVPMPDWYKEHGQLCKISCLPALERNVKAGCLEDSQVS